MSAIRVLLFFSFTHQQENYAYDLKTYPCALVEWFEKVESTPNANTGVWVVRPEYRKRRRVISVVHIDSLFRRAHLIPVFGRRFLLQKLHISHCLDLFSALYVSHYVDHHTDEIV